MRRALRGGRVAVGLGVVFPFRAEPSFSPPRSPQRAARFLLLEICHPELLSLQDSPSVPFIGHAASIVGPSTVSLSSSLPRAQRGDSLLSARRARSITGVVLCSIISVLLSVDGLPYTLRVSATGRERIGQRT